MNDEERRKRLPSKGFVVALYVPLLVPALLPLWMARDQDDPVIVAIMVGTALFIAIFNAVALTLIYRWFARTTDS